VSIGFYWEAKGTSQTEICQFYISILINK
jgi:hypothetical protein